MSEQRKQAIVQLLKGIESGDPTSVQAINPDKYIQHNPQTLEGRDGLAALFAKLAKTNPRVNFVRLFADGDFVFAHMEYYFSVARVGFEVFRFENDFAVEHWDNIQSRLPENASGHSMVDGETQLDDAIDTESSRQLVRDFVQRIHMDKSIGEIDSFVDSSHYIEHDSLAADGIEKLADFLQARRSDNSLMTDYSRCHRVLAEHNFALSVCEGMYDGQHTAFYDLFRISGGKVVEHWVTREAVPEKSLWQNDNGKF